MERKEFLTYLGATGGAFVIASCLGACGKDDSGTPNPDPVTPGQKVDFTLDVSTNADIISKGWTTQKGVIIAKNGAAYIALAAACTHQGNPMTYNAANNNFPCSLQDATHGSVFDAAGAKISGPAIGNLQKYNTTLTGNSLRVFES